jgi:hypothetical protein
MHTSIVLVALAGTAVASNAVSTEVNWHGDYAAALREGRSARKPLAVFVGTGSHGWDRLSKEGRLNRAATDLLKAEYVCVYVDLDRRAGREMAGSFEIAGGPGLVLSDRRGDNQAFRHEGTLDDADLERQLRKYSDPERVVSRTETIAQATISYYPPQPAPAPVYAPAAPVAPYYPAPVMGGFGGGFSGGFSGGGRGGC